MAQAPLEAAPSLTGGYSDDGEHTACGAEPKGACAGVAEVSRTRRRTVKPGPAYAAALAALPPALRPIAEAIAPVVAALVREQSFEADPVVDICASVPRSRRAVQRACRAGEIDGATKNGRAWLARRSAVDAWLAGQRPVPARTARDDDDDLDEVRSALGLRVVGGRR